MKLFATVSAMVLSMIFLTANVFAQVQYSADVEISGNGRSSVKLTITFQEPEPVFNFTIKGRVENFVITSNAGPAACKVKSGIITFVDCVLSLTKEKRTVYINYETLDFVKISDNYFFDGDFNINRDVTGMTVSVTLPEGMLPVREVSSIFPSNSTVSYDVSGSKLTVFWNLANLKYSQMPRFQVLYEPLQQGSVLQLWYFVVAAAVIAGFVAFIVFRYMRKSEKLVLSVLDDFERRVVDSIIAAGGVVNQKKVVIETNLSKAKVSRVVKSLLERGLIEVERMGRTNKLKLIKKKLGI